MWMFLCIQITFNNPLKARLSKNEYILYVKLKKSDNKIVFVLITFNNPLKASSSKKKYIYTLNLKIVFSDLFDNINIIRLRFSLVNSINTYLR